MILVGLVEDVNQKKNKHLIGRLVLLEEELDVSSEGLLCYREHVLNMEDWFHRIKGYDGFDKIYAALPLLHEVTNVEIIGVL